MLAHRELCKIRSIVLRHNVAVGSRACYMGLHGMLTFLDARATVATVSAKLVRCSSLTNWLSWE